MLAILVVLLARDLHNSVQDSSVQLRILSRRRWREHRATETVTTAVHRPQQQHQQRVHSVGCRWHELDERSAREVRPAEDRQYLIAKEATSTCPSIFLGRLPTSLTAVAAAIHMSAACVARCNVCGLAALAVLCCMYWYCFAVRGRCVAGLMGLLRSIVLHNSSVHALLLYCSAAFLYL